jgi:hypothetical protein
VLDRHLIKSRKRFEAAHRQSTEAFEEALIEMHIEIVNELITPDFRMEFQKRLEALHERLQQENDFDKLQMVVILETALELKTPPISRTGLISQIYNRTIQQSLEEQQEERNLLARMTAEFDLVDADPQEVYAAIETPENLKTLEAELVKHPRLMARMQQRISNLLDDFEKELRQGQVKLELFTLQELALPIQRLQVNLGETAQSFDASKEDAQKQIFAVFNETVAEIFTPERWQKFYRDMQDTARKWIIARNAWGTALHTELSLLDKEKYEQSRFVLFVFWGQLGRLSAPKNRKRSKKRA